METSTKSRRIRLAAAAGGVFLCLWGVRRWQQYKMYSEGMRDAQEEANRAVPVKVYLVQPRDVAGSLRRIGTVRARAETNVQFGLSGRLQRFDVEKGQFVKKGALLAALDQQEARNALAAVEAEFQKVTEKYFKDRTIDKLEYERGKARYNQARLDAAKTAVHAPHDGYLVEKWASAGEQVEAGAVVGKLMDKSRVSVEMDLSEDDIAALKTGQKVAVTVDAVEGYKAEGTVLSITPYLKGESRSFNVKVDLPDNPDEKLNPGMFARCVIRRYEKSGAIVVPVDAAAEMKGEEVRLFAVGDDNVAHAKTLKVVFSDESLVEVEGLAAGARVVLNPGADLREGVKVEVRGGYDPDSAGGGPENAKAPEQPESSGK